MVSSEMSYVYILYVYDCLHMYILYIIVLSQSHGLEQIYS